MLIKLVASWYGKGLSLGCVVRKNEGRRDQAYGKRVIPVIVKYNGQLHKKSKEMLEEYLPEVDEPYLCKHIFLAIAWANTKAKETYHEEVRQWHKEHRDRNAGR